MTPVAFRVKVARFTASALAECRTQGKDPAALDDGAASGQITPGVGMIVGVLDESGSSEHRVALVPAAAPVLAKLGLALLVEKGAGRHAGFSDVEYEAAGASIAEDRARVFSQADVLACVHRPVDAADLERIGSGQVMLGLLDPLGSPQAAQQLASKGATSFALELLPRISRAQSMDALSSMATVSGYKAALLAATTLHKMYPLMMTAAGTVTPARVFVVGAGVAGLQAIATSRRLGAVVHAYDVRPAVREQVETLGARFVDLGLDSKDAETSGGYARAMDDEFYRRQREGLAAVVADNDVVLTTAAVPGKKAPVLVTAEMVRGMRPGSVIVDLAAESGGNCELTRAGETIHDGGVTIIGPVNLASTVPYHASQMYARNLSAFLANLVSDGAVTVNLEDPILGETLVTHGGEVCNPRVREVLGLPAHAGKD